MTEKIPLSVAIITKDEAANLPGCLKSVAFARQIVVVDSGSADGTLEIARDVARKLIEARREREGESPLPAATIPRDYTIVVAA